MKEKLKKNLKSKITKEIISVNKKDGSDIYIEAEKINQNFNKWSSENYIYQIKKSQNSEVICIKKKNELIDSLPTSDDVLVPEQLTLQEHFTCIDTMSDAALRFTNYTHNTYINFCITGFESPMLPLFCPEMIDIYNMLANM